MSIFTLQAASSRYTHLTNGSLGSLQAVSMANLFYSLLFYFYEHLQYKYDIFLQIPS